eukprot:5568608-Heterocapsa_arctica.AAC.1
MHLNLLRLNICLSSSEVVQNDQRVVRNPMVIGRGPAGCAKSLEFAVPWGEACESLHSKLYSGQ